MAPPKNTGVKRVAATSPSKRQLKVARSQADIPKIDPTMVAVTEAVDSAAELPAHCKAMLLASLPFCLGVPADTRNAHMVRMVDMVRETFEATMRRLQSLQEEDELKLSEVAASKGVLVVAVDAANTVLVAKSEAVAAKQKSLEEVQAAFRTALAELRSEREAIKTSEEAVAKAINEQDEVQKAIDVHFAALMAKDVEWNLIAASEHGEALRKVVKECLKVDESLILSVTSSMGKAPADRGDFDAMVLEQLRKYLVDRIAELVAMQAVEGAKKDELVEAAEISQSKVGRAQDAEVSAQNELGTAKGEESDASAALREATEMRVAFEPQLAIATAARDDKKNAVTRFQAYNMVAFDKLAQTNAEEQAAVAIAEGSAPNAGA